MSDKEIIRLIKSENEEDVQSGMERLVETYGDRIDTTVWRHSQALDPHSREDIRQDVLLKIRKQIKDSYRHEGKLWAYIETVIKGMSIDTYEKKGGPSARLSVKISYPRTNPLQSQKHANRINRTDALFVKNGSGPSVPH